MPSVTEATATPLPRRGRLWVILALALAAFRPRLRDRRNRDQEGRAATLVKVEGIAEAQEIFGGVPQEGDRLGSDDAPVSIQVFTDLQCGSCRDDFLGTIPGLVEDYVRPGDVKLLLRHYSVAENPLELGFFGAEAAAQQGYGWQYTYLFFRNQEEAERLGRRRRLPGLDRGLDRRTRRARMAANTWKPRAAPTGDREDARGLRANSAATWASAPARRRSSTARAERAPCRTALPARSSARWKRSATDRDPSLDATAIAVANLWGTANRGARI